MSEIDVKGKAANVVFDKVSKVYGKDVLAVDSISIDVEAGQLVTLLGPSGCGKTTTLRMIAGLEGATNGQIFIGETDVTNLPPSERDVSMVFQSYALFPHKTVIENVSYGLIFSGNSKADAKKKAVAGLDTVGLSHLAERYPSELSGGQQQRVAVARALVLEPQVLLFDEPLSNLDAKLRRSVRDEIRELQQRLNLTVVYVTHDQEEALAVSDKIIVMEGGKVAQVGTPHELYDSPASLFVANFIGESNILECQVKATNNSTATVEMAGKTLQIPASEKTKGKASLVVRPEHITLSDNDEQAGLEGVVQKATYIGSKIEYIIHTGAGDIFVTTSSNLDMHPQGSTIFLSIPTEKMLLFQ